MSTSITVAIISALVSLGGIWLTYYLGIRRELLLRGRPAESGIISEVQSSMQPRVSAPVSGRGLTIKWWRALLALSVCPLVDLVLAFIILRMMNRYYKVGYVGDLLSSTLPPLYTLSIIGLFPLQIFFYRRFDGKGERLLFTTATWAVVSAVYFLIQFKLLVPAPVLQELLKQALTLEQAVALAGAGVAFAEAGGVAGAISGLLFWLITCMSLRRPNVLRRNRESGDSGGTAVKPADNFRERARRRG